MEKLSRRTDITRFASDVFDMYFAGMNFATFDIETTGLSPRRARMILGGFCGAASEPIEPMESGAVSGAASEPSEPIEPMESGAVSGAPGSSSESRPVLRQYFAESLDEEADVLRGCVSELSRLDFIITYNGRMFDIPFMEQRMRSTGLNTLSAADVSFASYGDMRYERVYDGERPVASASCGDTRYERVYDGERPVASPSCGDTRYEGEYDGERPVARASQEDACSSEKANFIFPYNLDLYPIVRYFSDIARFTPNLRQKTLEDFMGLWTDRTDEISGGESVSLYFDYLASRDKDVRDKILLHNADDVLQLYKLLDVLKRTDFHAAMTHYGFPVKTAGGIYVIENIALTGKTLDFKGRRPTGSASFMDYGRGNMTCDMHTPGTFDISAHIDEREGYLIADLDELGIAQTDFVKLPTYGSGYLVLAAGGQQNHMEINLLARKVLEHICENIE